MRRLALLCLLACAAADARAAAADDAALQTVEACRTRLDPRVDIGIERISRKCPDLLPALRAAPWSALVPGTLAERREELSARSLQALEELVRGAAGAAVTPRLDPQQLAPVLAELGEQGQQGATRWERFKRWLKDKFERRTDDDEPNLLERLSRQFEHSEGVARALTYLGYALVAALLLYVVWAELRAAGLLGGARRDAGRNNPAAEWRRRLMLADVAAAPLADRPGMLLRLLGEALTRAQRLPAADGLTAGAIAQRARLDAAEDRAELASVAQAAEAVRYAQRRPDDGALQATVDTAKRLLARFAGKR